MALNFTGFKQKLFSLMKKNESDKAYSLTWAGTAESGWSYGWVQFDLANGPDIGNDKFWDILQNAKDSNGNKIIPKDQEIPLYNASLSTGGAGLTPEQIALIDDALGSAYGRQTIDNATSKHLDNLIAFADSWISKPVTKVPDSDKPFLQSDLGKLWLCDVKNQGFVRLLQNQNSSSLFFRDKHIEAIPNKAL